MHVMRHLLWLTCGLFFVSAAYAAERVQFDLHEQNGCLNIRVDDRPFAEYVWKDEQIPRPYFRQVRAPGGIQVTRNLPPIAGKDAVDHDTMHPGIWLSFGDISGVDFWRNKATTRFVEFVEPPTSSDDQGRFAVRLRYQQEDRVVCEEVCVIVIRQTTDGILIDWTSAFRGDQPFTFGDQEEMGLGVRMATPLAVKTGGSIRNQHGQRNEAEVWGKTADWCDYHGVVEGQPVGICLMPDPKNFRPSWFHVRDTGLMVANPFGQNAFTRGEKSAFVIQPQEEFRLRFGILVHAGEFQPQPAYARWIKREMP